MKQFLAILTPNSTGGYMPVGLDEITVIMTRTEAGAYKFSGDFPQGQTFPFVSQVDGVNATLNYDSEDSITLHITNENGLCDEGSNIPIHIIVTE